MEIIKFNVEELKLFLYWSLKSHFHYDVPTQSRNFWDEFSKYLCNAATGSKFYIGDMICFLSRSNSVLLFSYSSIIERPTRTQLLYNSAWYNSSFKIYNIRHFQSSKNKNNFIVSKNLLNKGLYLRRWIRGDRLISSTSKKHTLVSDIFINNKLSGIHKLIQPIVVNRLDEIVWIPGIVHAQIKNLNASVPLKNIEWIPAQ